MNIFKQEIIVLDDHIDLNGHVNNVQYLQWFFDSSIAHSASLNAGMQFLQTLDATWVVKSHHIEYKKSAYKGDVLELKTWIDSIQTVQSQRNYSLYNKETNSLICEGYTSWVFVDNKRFRPKKIPKELMQIYGY